MGERSSGRGRRAGRVRAAVVGAAAAVLLVAPACTPSSPEPRAELLPDDGGAPGPDDPGRPRRDANGDIDFKGLVVSYRGFLIKLVKGTFPKPASEFASPTFVLATEVTNPMEDTGTFFGRFALEDGTSEVGTGIVEETVKVLPGATVPATVRFSLARAIDRSKTTLFLGRPGDARVRVPLGGKGDVVTLMPVDQDVPPAMRAGPLTFTTTAMQVRYSPVWGYGDDAPQGKALLHLRVKATAGGGVRFISYDEEGVRLTLPSGQDVHPADLRQLFAGEHKDETWIAFAVPEPYAGTYSLAMTATEPAGASGTVSFEVKGPPPGSTAPPSASPPAPGPDTTARTTQS